MARERAAIPGRSGEVSQLNCALRRRVDHRRRVYFMKAIGTVAMVCLLAAGVVGGAVGCKKQATEAEAAKQYTCPMHPEVVQNGPGKCPKCGMELKPKKG